MAMLDVTDTFDAFHRVVTTLWREFGIALAADTSDDSASFDDLVDQLELDLFLPVCARRLRNLTGESVEPEGIAARLRLIDETGEPLPGAAGQYHSHAFHPDGPEADVPNAILTAALMSLPRSGLRLQLGPPPEPRRFSSRLMLPVH